MNLVSLSGTVPRNCQLQTHEFDLLLLLSGWFNIAAGFSTTEVIVRTWMPLVERRVVVMLFGSLELVAAWTNIDWE
jgi:hypothetical protein